MNKKAALAVVLIIVIVGVAYFFFAKKTAVAPTLSPSTTPEQTSISSLRELLSKGVAQSCTYSADKSKGTIYMSGKNIRGDFEITDAEIDGQATISHMIILDSTNYIWTEGSKTGIKMDFDAAATPNPSSSPASSFSADTSLNYKCSPWITDTSMFTLPAGVQFSGLTISKQCSFCDSLSGDDKTQCLTALKCN